MSFLDKISVTLKNPKNAMKSIAEQPMIEDAAMIIGIYSILNALIRYMESYNPPVVVTILSTAGGLVGGFLIWVIFSFAFRGINSTCIVSYNGSHSNNGIYNESNNS